MDFELDKNVYDRFKKIVSSCMNNDNYELEVRIGKYINDTVFIPGIEYNIFKKILEELYANSNFKNLENFEILTIGVSNGDTKLLKCAKYKKNIKKLCHNEKFINEDIYFLKKTKKLDLLDIQEYNLRIERSSEEALESSMQNEIINNKQKFYRYKQRYSFESMDKNFKIDLSVTKNSPNFEDFKQGVLGYGGFVESNILNKPNNFEIEIEYLPNTDLSGKTKEQKLDKLTTNFLNNINFILKYVQNTEFPMPKSTNSHILRKYTESFLMNEGNKTTIHSLPVTRKNYFLGADTCVLKSENLVKKEDVEHEHNYLGDTHPNDYAVTVKADGERHLLYIDADGYAYLLNSRVDFKNTGMRFDKNHGNTLIDGEYLDGNNTFLAFDLLFHNSTDYRYRILYRLGEADSEYPESRYEKLNNVVELLKLNKNKYASNLKSSFNIILKKHYFPSIEKKDIFKLSSYLWNNRINMFKYNADGLIFTPRKELYHDVSVGFRWKNNLKWKPLALTSIDFLVNIKKDSNGNDKLNAYRYFDEETNNSQIKHYKITSLRVGSRMGKNYVPKLFTPLSGSEEREIDCWIARIFVDKDDKIYAKSDDSKEEIHDGDIVEFIYDKKRGTGFEWIPIRVRHDKTAILKKTGSISNTANDIQIATSIWNSYHELDGQLLEENIFDIVENDYYYQRIKTNVEHKVSKYYTHNETESDKFDLLEERSKSLDSNIRNFNNYVKHVLYQTIVNHYRNVSGINDLSLLDLGAGRGGDIKKYIKNDITKVHAIDYDKVNIKNFQKRYMELDHQSMNNLKLELYVGDFTKLMNNGDASHKIDANSRDKLIAFYKTSGFYIFNIISCQFAMHYAFKDEYSLRGFIHNIYNNLPLGGLFFGTCFDGKKLFNLLKTNKGYISGNINEKSIYEIRMDQKNTFKNFGTEIEFKFSSIGDKFITEYLVDMDYFVDVLKNDYDIVLITDEESKEMKLPSGNASFEEFYNIQKNFVLDETEQQLAFGYDYFIFKKIGTGDGKTIANWNKKLAL